MRAPVAALSAILLVGKISITITSMCHPVKMNVLTEMEGIEGIASRGGSDLTPKSHLLVSDRKPGEDPEPSEDQDPFMVPDLSKKSDL